MCFIKKWIFEFSLYQVCLEGFEKRENLHNSFKHWYRFYVLRISRTALLLLSLVIVILLISLTFSSLLYYLYVRHRNKKTPQIFSENENSPLKHILDARHGNLNSLCMCERKNHILMLFVLHHQKLNENSLDGKFDFI